MKKDTLIVLFGILVSSVAMAGSPESVAPNNPCMPDVHKYCSDVTPGNGRLAHCMKKHASELSASCKAYGKKYVKKHPNAGKG